MNEILKPVRLREVMRRTMFNLKYIQQHRKADGPFEVTQLVNSFLGALAHPWEQNKGEFGQSLDAAVRDGWPRVRKGHITDANPVNLGDLLRMMRNGLAHGNIEFLSDDQKKIAKVCITDINPDTKARVWGAELSVKDMKLFLEKFVRVMTEKLP